MMTSQDDSQ